MILQILKYPDPRLREVADPVDSVTPELQEFAEDMVETMHANDGIGLAATQVGKRVRLIVMDLSGITIDPLIMFNPKIVRYEGERKEREACLSVTGVSELVMRKDVIDVVYLDESGESRLLTADGLLSTCIQHEIDHLDGRVFVDRLSAGRKERIKRKLKKIKRVRNG